jgi:alpha-tubulin suppressor-like RCC1 family protein
MTGPSRHVAHLHCLAMLTVSLCCASALAAPPPEPQELAEKESVEKWRRRNARHVLALYEGQALAAAQDGSLWVWGQGPGEWVGSWPEIEVAQGTPTRVPGIRNVVSVATANDVWRSPALALLEDGTVLSWGQDNSIGQLGDGTTQNRRTRAPVQGLDHVVAISASAGFALAVRADGTVWAWGGNGCGELGDGTTESRSLPVQVVGLTQVVAVAANWGSSSYALRSDGTVWAWGCGYVGQLGDGTRMDHHVPIHVPGLTDVVAIETRTDTVYALRADGTVWVWGLISEGQNGQMPQPGAPIQPVPVQVPGLSRVVSLAAGYAHALAVRRDGTVWEWGHDTRGPLGNGGQNPIGPVRQVQGLHGVEAVAAGSPFSMALKHDGTLWTWGGNHSGGMGTGSDRRLSPSPVALRNVRAIASSPSRMLALRTDGTVWTWGSSLYDFATQATPVRVEGLDGATKIAAGGSHMLALRTDGTLWAWGANRSGELGDGTTTTRLTPAPVANLTGVVEMAAGGSHSLALRSDGTVWTWGANYYGQLGDMTLQNRSTAAQVQGLTDVTAVFAHEGLSLALRTDGSVWWWGSTRPAWRRGDRRPHAPEPVQGLTNIVKLGATNEDVFAVRADGTVWKWTVGVPGEVNPAQQVAGFTDAVDVAGNNYLYFFQNTLPGLTFPTLQVLRADGTVWTTGDNLMGERGFPSPVLAPPGPTKVPGLTGVVAISASLSHVHAVRADGTAVGWGDNANGLIGDGIPPWHFTPVRVPLPRRLSQE